MFLNAAEAQTYILFGKVSGFDVFMVLFTILIAYGVIRTMVAPTKNKFAITFGVISLLSFLIMDSEMVRYWFN